MSDDMIPLPRPTALSEPHWNGCREGKLMVQRCKDCGSHIFMPKPQFDAPYVVAIIELDEGWHMLSNLVNCDPGDVAMAMPVKVRFKAMNEDITLPYFEPL